MSRVKFELSADMEDGTTLVLVGDQRDVALAEAAELPFAARTLLTRHIAYTAAKRAGQFKGSWAQWSDQCIEAYDSNLGDDEDDADGEGEQGLDPGRKTPPAGG